MTPRKLASTIKARFTSFQPLLHGIWPINTMSISLWLSYWPLIQVFLTLFTLFHFLLVLWFLFFLLSSLPIPFILSFNSVSPYLAQMHLHAIFPVVSFCTLINPSDFIKHSLAILTSSSPFLVALPFSLFLCTWDKNRVRPVLEGFQALWYQRDLAWAGKRWW